jgi:hypothetical protein
MPALTDKLKTIHNRVRLSYRAVSPMLFFKSPQYIDFIIKWMGRGENCYPKAFGAFVEAGAKVPGGFAIAEFSSVCHQ